MGKNNTPAPGSLLAEVASRAFCNLIGLPRDLPIKCRACGVRASQTVKIHMLRRFYADYSELEAFLCCRHLRAFTGQPCCEHP